MIGDSSADRRLQDNIRRIDEKLGFIQDLLSEKIDHLRSEVQGNDKRYAERFAAQEEANKYDQEKSNEFRGALDDVGKRQMPRTEAEAMFRSIAEKADLGISGNAAKIEALQARIDRNEGRSAMAYPALEKLMSDTASLTQSRSEGAGEKGGRLSQQQMMMMIVSLIVSLIVIGSVVVGIAYAIRR